LACFASVGSSPALAVRGHVFEKPIGKAGSGPGEFKEPAGLAVNEETGNLYVVDAGNSRVEVFDEKGEFQSEFTGPSATGTGALSAAEGTGNTKEGSETVEGVTTSSGAFAVGQSISGPGIPEGATIFAVGSGTLTLSAAATAEGTVALKAGSRLITAVSTESGVFTVGEEVKAPGLPAEAKIVAVKEGGALELSAPATREESASLTAHQTFFFGTKGIAGSSAVAVDNSTEAEDPSKGDIYVTSGEFKEGEAGEMVIDKFTATGGYLGQIRETSETSHVELFDGIAVDPRGGLWATQTANNSTQIGIDSFSDAPSNVFIPPLIAVDGKTNGIILNILDPAGGLAVDSEGDLYVHISPSFGRSPVWKVDPAAPVLSNVLNKELDPEANVANNGVATELASDDVYVDNVSSVKRFAPDGSLIESFGEPQLTGASCPAHSCTDGVAVNSVTGHVYVSEAVTGVVLAYEPHPSTAPDVASESVLEITSESATLAAEINPQTLPLPGELTTSYRFEYGACATPSTCKSSAYGTSTPTASLAPSFELEPVSAHVDGLTAGRAYHYRVIAENRISKEHGQPVEGPEQTFTTAATGEFVLPDGRQWEMVSPPKKEGAVIEPLSGTSNPGGAVQAAAAGGAVSYVTNTPTESGPEGYSQFSQVLSTRGPSGWSSHDIAVPHLAATGVSIGAGQEVRFLSEDLSSAVVQPFGAFDPSISSQATEQTAFLHSDYASPGFREPCTSSCFQPLVDGANATAGEPFGQEGDCGAGTHHTVCGPVFVGGTPDLSHVILRSTVPLTAGSSGGLYEYSTSKPASEQLQPVSGPGALLGLGGEHGGDAGRNAISHDGSRVFSSVGGHLGMSDTLTHMGLSVDTPEPEPGCPAADHCGEGPVDAEFQGASEQGNIVFFTDTQKLTADGGSYAEPRIAARTAADLYECEVVEVAGALKCVLTDLTPGGAQLGSVLGASKDGSWVYFVANGVLKNGGVPVAGAASGSCPNGVATGFEGALCNLYVRHDGETKLVAGLSSADAPDWATQLQQLTARVSPSGRYLAFMSRRSLTGYDNRDAVSGKPDEEVYLYDGQTGKLVCASCDPTGARPHGVEYGRNGNSSEFNLPLAGGNRVWEGSTWLAANIPTWTPYEVSNALYQSPYLSDSGRLFFNSVGGLVPKDGNKQVDVYEYEPQGLPAGEHACSPSSTTGSEVFKPEREVKAEAGTPAERTVTEGAGCVALISSGESSRESAFLDASASGADVYFITAAKLAPQDLDDALDVYDAHECTSSSPCPPPAVAAPAPCDNEASCKAAPSPQPAIFGLSGSATFSGLGNLTSEPPPPPKVKTAEQLRLERLSKALKACRSKHNKRNRQSCEKQARKRYAKASAKRSARRATTNRRPQS